jgi:hypothetical protein
MWVAEGTKVNNASKETPDKSVCAQTRKAAKPQRLAANRRKVQSV